MAEEETQKNQETTEDAEEPKKKGGMLKFILIPVILLIQAVGAYFFVFNVLVEHPNKPPEPVEKKKTVEVGQFYEINDLVINPAGTQGRRFLVIEMGLETDKPELLEEAKLKEIWIRDAIITLLAKKEPDELLDFNLRRKLKTEILTVLNKKLSTGKFNRVYFKKYIMQ